MGLENFRYFMLREVPFGGDGDFSQKALIDRINSDLGNDFGNLLNRVIGMSGKYFNGEVRCDGVERYYQSELNEVEESIAKLEPLIFELQLHKFLEELWRPLSIANRAIDKYQPWNMMKEGRVDEVMALNGLIAMILAKVSLMLYAVMPKTTQTVANALGFEINPESFNAIIREKKILEPFVTKRREPLFPRIEKELLEEKRISSEKEPIEEQKNLISIDEFFKTELKVGTIIDVREVKKSKKLLLLQVDVGEDKPRQIVAGIKEYYTPDELLNTQVSIVANLKPAKIMGIKSEGMVLASRDESGLSLIRPEHRKENGSDIS